ncbi:hypothetical protein R0G64_32890, partial [Pseudomonas otitidis]|nr:hypothetical protein [Pseudomonas otitidis]
QQLAAGEGDVGHLGEHLETAALLAADGFRQQLARQVGWGASGRNGGQLIRGVGHDVDHFAPVIGAEGVR